VRDELATLAVIGDGVVYIADATDGAWALIVEAATARP